MGYLMTKIDIEAPTWNSIPQALRQKLLNDIDIICPRIPDIFKAFEETPPSKTKVIILGQDPYHTPGKARGVAFGYHFSYWGKIDSSLANIIKEVGDFKADTTLSQWTKQGVLLLNTRLTVKEGKPMSHKGIGWESIIQQYLTELTRKKKNLVILLWGAEAQKYRKFLDEEDNLILETSHPCRFSAHLGFLGCGHFDKTNEYLKSKDIKPIIW